MTLTARVREVQARRNAWRSMFRDEDGQLTQAGKVALSDLRKFCHVDRPTIKVSPKSGQIDPLAMAIAEGRREVFLRIAELLKLDDRDLEALLRQQFDEVYNV